MSKLSKEEILASSKGWIASLLNFFPGIGSGYIYQRRWVAYFVTLLATISWFTLGIILQANEEPTKTEQIIGISGILMISIFTVLEANIAYKKAFKTAKKIESENKPAKKKVWFK
tara:strand:+ start:125 stop:469 length:345 start_codon:yes stop_codon:yes gene_type:complete